jgi:hypothetical protein
MVTILAILFILFLIGTIAYGFGIVIRRPATKDEMQAETCSLCRERFPKHELIERAVGDSRLYYFCHKCIARLHDEMGKKDVPAGLDSKRLLSEFDSKKN